MIALLAQTNLDRFNPIVIERSTKVERFSSPGGILTEILLNYAFPIAGMILFVMILWGGFEIITSATSGKKDAGRQRITTAILGFILLFCSYWIAQIIQAVFGVSILD